MEKLRRNSNGAKLVVSEKDSGKDEGAFETTFAVFYKNVLIILQIKIRQKSWAGAPPPPPHLATPLVEQSQNDVDAVKKEHSSIRLIA